MEGTLQSSTQRIPVPFCVKMQPFTGSSFFFSLSLSLSRPRNFAVSAHSLSQSVTQVFSFGGGGGVGFGVVARSPSPGLKQHTGRFGMFHGAEAVPLISPSSANGNFGKFI